MDSFESNNSIATAPPPPQEVKIRTMKSDLAAMQASGGGMPKFENVKVSGLAAVQQGAVERPGEASVAATRAESKSNLVLIVVLVVILVVLAVVGWLVYMKVKG